MAILESELLEQKSNIGKIKAMDSTFKNNQTLPIHRWYPYIEGFSENFVKSILKNYSENITVYDPFNGSGTTTFTASFLGVKCFASEINPLMRFIATTKVNTVRNIIKDRKVFELENIFKKLSKSLTLSEWNQEVCQNINPCYLEKDFFDDIILLNLAYIKQHIIQINDQDIVDILKLCLASIVVEVSNMIRAADLRKRKIAEKNIEPQDVKIKFLNKLSIVISDIKSLNERNLEKIIFISDNAKNIDVKFANTVDLIITSPPYVNGTNYFRNTKLELWILDYINNENDLKLYRENAITAGINNVSNKNQIEKLEFVEPYSTKLDKISPDKRIPKMIRAYFSDMNRVFKNFNMLLKPGGKIYFDIGDSEYYGIHIPVDKLIGIIANRNGFYLADEKLLRKRRSKNGNSLCQKLLIFTKNG